MPSHAVSARTDLHGAGPWGARVLFQQRGVVDPVDRQGPGVAGPGVAGRDGETYDGGPAIRGHLQIRFQPEAGNGGDRLGQAHFGVVPREDAIGVGRRSGDWLLLCRSRGCGQPEGNHGSPF